MFLFSGAVCVGWHMDSVENRMTFLYHNHSIGLILATPLIEAFQNESLCHSVSVVARILERKVVPRPCTSEVAAPTPKHSKASRDGEIIWSKSSDSQTATACSNANAEVAELGISLGGGCSRATHFCRHSRFGQIVRQLCPRACADCENSEISADLGESGLRSCGERHQFEKVAIRLLEISFFVDGVEGGRVLEDLGDGDPPRFCGLDYQSGNDCFPVVQLVMCVFNL